MSTTAISFRQGNTEENNAFAGVAGEIVADLGNGQSINENATIILHTGDGTPGGIRMARKDCKNIEWEDLYSNSNVAGSRVNLGFMLNDLSNIKNSIESVQVAEEVSEILQENFNLASADGKNLNTNGITNDAIHTGEGPIVATVNLNNISQTGINKINEVSFENWENRADDAATILATDINESGSTQGVINPLARADLSNVDPSRLSDIGFAKNDLSNVTNEDFVDKIDDAYPELTNCEDNRNKKQEIYEGNNTSPGNKNSEDYYPSIKATSSYVDSNISNCANKFLNNINSWSVATRKEISYIYEVKHVSGDATGYDLSNLIETDIWSNELDNDESGVYGGYLTILPINVDSHGIITAEIITPSNGYFSEQLSSQILTYTYNYNGVSLVFNITYREVNPGNLMLSDFSNSEIKSYDNNYKGLFTYEIDETDAGRITKIYSINGQIYDTSTISRFGAKQITNKGAVAMLESYSYTGGDIENPVIDKYSNIIVTKESAYLNKQVNYQTTESLDTNHELLNRSEIQQMIDSAIAQSNLLESIYPVGALYIGTQSTCPMAALIPNSTWALVATDRALWGGDGTNANTTIAAGLPDIQGTWQTSSYQSNVSGAVTLVSTYSAHGWDGEANIGRNYKIAASTYNSIYGNSNTVQPPAYIVNVWRRTA